MPLVDELMHSLSGAADAKKAAVLLRYFKTAPGQYGHGDRFLGVPLPILRPLMLPYRDSLTLTDCAQLLGSQWHEARLAALLLLVSMAERLRKQNDLTELEELVVFYDRNLERANNWDLIDISAPKIMGAHWECTDNCLEERKQLLEIWVNSENLWRQRAAVVSTLSLIRRGMVDETLWLAEHFLFHRHDLMHKAVGWTLREVGKVNAGALRNFLAVYSNRLPRTALRYAIEHMDSEERKKWMERPRKCPHFSRKPIVPNSLRPKH